MERQCEICYVTVNDGIYLPSDMLANALGAPHEFIINEIEKVVLPMMSEEFTQENYLKFRRQVENGNDDDGIGYLISGPGLAVMMFPGAVSPIIAVCLNGFSEIQIKMKEQKSEDKKILKNMTKSIPELKKYYFR